MIFQGNTGKVYSTPTLGSDATITLDSTLDIPEGHPLAIGGGTTLTNNGTINNYGGITKRGNATFTNFGTINSPSRVKVGFSTDTATYDDDIFAITATASAYPGINALRSAEANHVDFWLGEVGSGTLLGSPEARMNPDGSTSATLALTKDVWDKGDCGAMKWALDANNTITVDFGGSAESSPDKLLASQGTGQFRVSRMPLSGLLTLSVSDRTYDGTPLKASLINNALEKGEVTYSYKAVGSSDDFVDGAPTNAGTYQIKARVVQTDHYSAAETPPATVSIAKKSAEFSVSLDGWVYGSAGSHIPAVSDNPGQGSVTFEYKRVGDPDSAYVDKQPTNAGTYTLKATIEATQNYLAASATCDFTIAPATQGAPSALVGKAETISNKADGTIDGLTTAMEYATSKTGSYTAVADVRMTFAAGTYYVRFAAIKNYNASAPMHVSIAPGKKLAVNLPSVQTGYTVSADKLELSWHEGVNLVFKIKDGWAEDDGFAVKVNDRSVALGADGAFSIEAVESDVAITVEGVAPAFTSQTIYDALHISSLSGMLAENAQFIAHPLNSGNAAYDALAKMAVGNGEDVLAAWEVKLVGNHKGKLVVSFQVGDSYNGKALWVYHQKTGCTVETFDTQVKGGWASVEVDGLSPFLVAISRDVAGGQGGADIVKPSTDQGGKDSLDVPKSLPSPTPKTGDRVPLAPCALAVLLLGVALVVIRTRKV